MPAKTNRFKLLEQFIAWQILLYSGGLEWNGGSIRFMDGFIFIFVFFLSSFVLFKSRMRIHKRLRNSSTVMIAVVFWLALVSVMSYFYRSEYFRLQYHFCLPVIALCVYFTVSSVEFKEFREDLLRALTILSAMTLIAYFLRLNFGLGAGSNFTLYFFKDWAGRMASVYWEPGQYQIIITFVLVLFLDEFRALSFSQIKYFVRKFGIVLLALVVCQSTMGYISLIIITGISFTFNKAAFKNKAAYLLLLIAGIAIVIAVFSSSVVQDKLDPKNLRRASSLYTRLQDNEALLNMSTVSPITGMGSRTQDYTNYSRIYGNRTASNGWLTLAVTHGYPFLCFFFVCIIRNLKRMKLGIPPAAAFIPLLVSQCNEFCAIFPIMYIYVFSFASYGRNS